MNQSGPLAETSLAPEAGGEDSLRRDEGPSIRRSRLSKASRRVSGSSGSRRVASTLMVAGGRKAGGFGVSALEAGGPKCHAAAAANDTAACLPLLGGPKTIPAPTITPMLSSAYPNRFLSFPGHFIGSPVV